MVSTITVLLVQLAMHNAIYVEKLVILPGYADKLRFKIHNLEIRIYCPPRMIKNNWMPTSNSIQEVISLVAPLDKNFIKVKLHKSETRALIEVK